MRRYHLQKHDLQLIPIPHHLPDLRPTVRSHLRKKKSPPINIPCLRIQNQIKPHNIKSPPSPENGDTAWPKVIAARSFHCQRQLPAPKLTVGPPPIHLKVEDLPIWVIAASRRPLPPGKPSLEHPKRSLHHRPKQFIGPVYSVASLTTSCCPVISSNPN